MNDNKKQLDQIYKQTENAKKEFTKIIVSGLSDSDPKEVTFTCELIKKELIPALELDKAESKRSSLETLNKLLTERRPPKDEHEFNDLENATFFKILNDIQNSKTPEENDTKEQFLKTKNTSIKQLKEQYSGRKFGELVLHHLKAQNSKRIDDAVLGLKESINPALIETTNKFIATIIYDFTPIKSFWKEDCGDALILYTSATKAEAKKFNIEVTDDYAYDIFNLIVLSLAQKALYDSSFKNFIKNSVKKYWLF